MRLHSRRSRLQRRAALLALLASGAAVTDALASVSFEASVSPGEVRFPATSELASRLTMRSGPQAETFAVEMTAASPFGDPTGVNAPQEGSPLGDAHGIATEGPVTLGVFSVRMHGHPLCSPSFLGRHHGEELSSYKVDVTLPPQSEGALIAKHPVARTAPWPTTDYRVRFLVTRRLVGPGASTLAADETVDSPAVRPTGVSGVRISLSTSPQTNFAAAARDRRVLRAGDSVAIHGTTSPALPGHRIALQYLGPQNSEELRTLALVDIDDSGRFDLSGWRPEPAGDYELWAGYRSQRADVSDDWMCPRVFRVEGEAPPAPRDEPRIGIESRFALVGPLGGAPIRVACAGGAACRGKLTLRRTVGRRGRTLSRRSFDLPAGAASRVYLRLPRRERRLVRRGGRISAVATATGSAGTDARRVLLRAARG